MLQRRSIGTRALITGASSGVGAEFARQLAAAGLDLVLVARNAARLEAFADELRSAHDVEVEVLPADLLTKAGVKAAEARVGASVGRIDVLVNNAGFGLARDFDRNSVDDELELLTMLVEVPLRLTHAALAHMLPAGSGTIINIASVAGFTPRGTYSAAKAWLLTFSRWANVAYRRRGVRITAIAPGFVRTEFHQRLATDAHAAVAADEVARPTQLERAVPDFMWLAAPDVVRAALIDTMRGRAVSIPSLRYKLIVALARLTPDALAERVARVGR
ncbi:SDR family NAD(P)-dependent oxidoreductase [Gryllotalpicola protaetiae]|uniref:SDR family NAD(P)-dependent oxidoreductase n=1 Tax=Gryllotalpicola protaetiae TaxID=2419771 RepID=UPI001FE98D94|nr:SDR family NAD(P)-dependent oxidoreductase [Gryllotalpicola protaetiae]